MLAAPAAGCAGFPVALSCAAVGPGAFSALGAGGLGVCEAAAASAALLEALQLGLATAAAASFAERCGECIAAACCCLAAQPWPRVTLLAAGGHSGGWVAAVWTAAAVLVLLLGVLMLAGLLLLLLLLPAGLRAAAVEPDFVDLLPRGWPTGRFTSRSAVDAALCAPAAAMTRVDVPLSPLLGVAVAAAAVPGDTVFAPKPVAVARFLRGILNPDQAQQTASVCAMHMHAHISRCTAISRQAEWCKE